MNKPKWEYRLVQWRSLDETDVDAFNILGELGWELVSVTLDHAAAQQKHDTNKPMMYNILFKRPKDPEAP